MKTFIAIGYVWPEPKSSAAGSRMMQILSLMQKSGFRVVFASPAEDSTHAIDLESIGIEKHSIRLNCSSFDEWVRAQSPDVVMFDRFMMEEQFGWRVEKHVPNAVRLLDMEDVHCLRDARHRAVKAGRKLSADDWHTDMAFREIASILRCDLTLVISEFEMTWLQYHFPIHGTKLLYTPFMVSSGDAEGLFLRFADLDFEARNDFVSIGNFRHAPNWDAVLQLREIWPDIRRRLPDAKLNIYGAYPPKKAMQLDKPELGFCVRGWANDAYQVIAESRVMLAPLRFGAGLKGKLLDAMLVGTPAVTSSLGAEGMYGECDQSAFVADDRDAFVDAATLLYSSHSAWQSCSSTGYELARGRFNDAAHGSRLVEAVVRLSTDIESHRKQDFLGGMLRHHSLKSTQYMSQWIEAKNRC